MNKIRDLQEGLREEIVLDVDSPKEKDSLQSFFSSPESKDLLSSSEPNIESLDNPEIIPSSNKQGDPEAEQDTTKPQTSHQIWELEYYKEYFNVSTSTIIHRITKAIWPFGPRKFIEEVKSPDLYVPLWVCITLIITLNVCGYLSQVGLSAYSPRSPPTSTASTAVRFSGETVSKTATFLLVLMGVNPLIFYLGFRAKGAGVAYLQVLALYGYSFLVFVPMSVLYLPHMLIYRFALIVTSAYLSLYFMYKNLGHLSQMFLGEYWDKLAKGYLVGCHTIFCLFMHFYIYA